MKNIKVMDIVLLVFSAVLCVGVKAVFHACPVMEDMPMACHWAEQAVFGMGIVLVVQALGLIILSKYDVRRGLSFAMIPTALVTAFIPKGLINLCMMNDMRCHTIMRPAVMILSIIIVICAFTNMMTAGKK